MLRSENLAPLGSRIERAELDIQQADAQVAGSTAALKAQWKANLPGIVVAAVGALVLRQGLRSTSPVKRDPTVGWAMRIAAPLISLGRARAMTALSALVAGLFAGNKLRPLATAPHVNLARFGGLWYEIARLPTQCQAESDRDVTVHYQIYSDGVRITNRSCRPDGTRKKAIGRAQVTDTATNAKLRVSFVPSLLDAIPAVWSDLWILDRAADYSTAIAGTPDRRSLWLLARAPSISDATFDSLVSKAESLEFDTTRLLRTRHTVPASPAAVDERVAEPDPLSAAA